LVDRNWYGQCIIYAEVEVRTLDNSSI